MFDRLPLILAQDTDAPDAEQKPISKDTAGGDTQTQTDGGSQTQQPDGQQNLPPRGPSFQPFFIILLGFLVLMIIFSMRSQRKQRRERDALLGALKKGNRVQTIGGILGTVVEVRDNKVIIKIDENTNTRMQMAKSAIQTILEDKSDTQEADLDKTGKS